MVAKIKVVTKRDICETNKNLWNLQISMRSRCDYAAYIFRIAEKREKREKGKNIMRIKIHSNIILKFAINCSHITYKLCASKKFKMLIRYFSFCNIGLFIARKIFRFYILIKHNVYTYARNYAYTFNYVFFVHILAHKHTFCFVLIATADEQKVHRVPF